ncbi:MAG TPA: CPBP family intramembrane glutamic endopeptidase [Candidatus Angelobacter sp.]|nr:CPBP family intramembrane glutamic endopeptidase [Candidatus Angelobacter sp.]
METEPAPAASSHPRNIVFFNDRGLRAGWRLLIYCAMIAALIFIAKAVNGFLARQGGNAAAAAQVPQSVQSILMAVGELFLFVVVLFLAWVMSRIEKRKVGAYGLPLQRSAVSTFFSAYVFWGFLPLTVLLLVLRAAGVFYFGHLSPLNGPILAWGILWWCFFFFVALFEEFFFRGYALYALADGIGFWPGAIIMALLFARAHMGNSGETKIGIVAVVCFALFAAATLWRTGNLWMAVGAHAGWDWGQSFFYGVNNSGFQAPGHLLNPHTQGPAWLSGGPVGPEGSVVTLILWVVMTVAVVVFYRRSRRLGLGTVILLRRE